MTVSTLGQQEPDRSSRTVAEWLWPLLPIAVSVFTLSALVYYHLRRHGLQVTSPLQVGVAWVYRSFGFAPAFVGFMLLLTWGSIWFVSGRVERPLARLARIGVMVVMLGVFLNLGHGGVAYEVHKGELGAWLGGVLVSSVGYYPGLVLVWAVTVAALLLATDFFFRDAFERLRTDRPEEVGVETEVTDHLRGLAATAVPTLPPAAAEAPSPRPPLPVTGAPVPEPARDLSDDAGEAPEVQPEVEPGFDAAPAAGWRARRASYFDRRRGAAGEDAAADAAWPPSAPESQEIENAEADEALGGDAEAAPRPELAAADVLDEAAAHEADDADEVLATEATEDTDDVDDSEDTDDVDDSEDTDDVDDVDEVDDSEDVVILGLHGRATRAPDRAVDAAQLASPTERDEPAERAERVAAAQPAREPEPAAADAFAPSAAGDADAAGVSRAEGPGDAEPNVAEDEAASRDRGFAVGIPRRHTVAADESTEAEAEALAQAAEPLVAIPRPTVTPAPARQQGLFGDGLDPELVEEAAEIVREARRVSAALLQRKLRIDFDLARRVLAELAARGVVELDEDEATGRVRG